ncbi:uncharacterized protein SMIM43 isoform X2 [Camelus bactrianus]|uniref:Uncharacterized protein SMIM43 isoform X2 n=1 Tax=Camelus bactrianus TaxID=9837 RepID=A0AC58NIB5_CAMBA
MLQSPRIKDIWMLFPRFTPSQVLEHRIGLVRGGPQLQLQAGNGEPCTEGLEQPEMEVFCDVPLVYKGLNHSDSSRQETIENARFQDSCRSSPQEDGGSPKEKQGILAPLESASF